MYNKLCIYQNQHFCVWWNYIRTYVILYHSLKHRVVIASVLIHFLWISSKVISVGQLPKQFSLIERMETPSGRAGITTQGKYIGNNVLSLEIKSELWETRLYLDNRSRAGQKENFPFSHIIFFTIIPSLLHTCMVHYILILTTIENFFWFLGFLDTNQRAIKE